MRVFTICSAGTCRSVAMSHRLKMDYGHDAVPIGRDYNSQCTIDMLSEWSEAIIVMEPKYASGILKKFAHKIVPPELTNVGPDVWMNAFSINLQGIIGEMAERLHEKGYLHK